MQLELRKFVAPEIVFGVGARRLAGQYAKNLGGRHALIVTDPGVLAAGWVNDVEASLDSFGVRHSIFWQVSPNPRSNEVGEGEEFYREQGCDVIVAVGGGSPIDCAKGIGIIASNGGTILDYVGVDEVPNAMPPLICVPTTGGTSADISQFVIIRDLERESKVAIISKAVVPDVSLVDPESLTSMDAFLTACTGIDALVHAIEAYVSNASSPLTDLHALQAISLIYPNLLPSLQHPAAIELRGRIMLGSLEAGLAFSNASLGGVHALAHSLGGLLDLPHGQCNALLLEHVVSYNFPFSSERYQKIGELMGLHLQGLTERQKKVATQETIASLRKQAGLLSTLGTVGMRRSDVPELAEHALGDPCIVTNPRMLKRRDMEVICEEAL
jgi:alcohol dehydrogenase class IV